MSGWSKRREANRIAADFERQLEAYRMPKPAPHEIVANRPMPAGSIRVTDAPAASIVVQDGIVAVAPGPTIEVVETVPYVREVVTFNADEMYAAGLVEKMDSNVTAGDDDYDPGCPASEPEEASPKTEPEQLARRVEHMEALEERHTWLQQVDASRRLQLMKPLSFAEWVFDFASSCGPKRLSDEEIGDAMEDMAKKVKKGRGPSWIYLKAASTLLWFLVNAAGETVKKVLGKSKTG